MLMTRSDRDLMISGNPASALLRYSAVISRQIVEHLVRHVAPAVPWAVTSSMERSSR